MEGNVSIKDLQFVHNFQRFNAFLLSADETRFFEWFVMKQVAVFNLKPFYYSLSKICNELRISKRNAAKIQKYFSDIGILQTEVKPLPGGGGKVTYYQVLFNNICSRLNELIDESTALYKDNQEQYKKLAQLQEAALTEPRKATISIKAKEEFNVNELFYKLNKSFEDAAEKWGEENGQEKIITQIPKAPHLKAAKKMLSMYDINTIDWAFYVFCRERLDSSDGVNVSTFFKYNKNKGTFPVLDYFISDVVQNWSRPKTDEELYDEAFAEMRTKGL